MRVIFFCLAAILFSSWGFLGHQGINQQAIYCLPLPLQSLFLKHQKQILQYATKPDQRRYAVANEAAKHFIDLDLYPDSLSPVMKSYTEIIHLMGDSFVHKHGIGPGNIQKQFQLLVHAFAQKDIPKIIRISGELGHYIADLHVPLHTSSNYDGQKTNQRGIHGFWETSLVKLLQKQKGNPYVPKPKIIRDLPAFIWQFTLESHQWVDTILELDRSLKNEYLHAKGIQFQKGKWFGSYQDKYLELFNDRQSHLVDKRLSESIHAVASIGYSAGTLAGEPSFELHNTKPIAKKKLLKINE